MRKVIGRQSPGKWEYISGSVYARHHGMLYRVANMDREEAATSPVERDTNAKFISHAPDLLDVLLQAEDLMQQANLDSTATQEERSAFIARFCNWWNHEAIPVIAEATQDPEYLEVVKLGRESGRLPKE